MENVFEAKHTDRERFTSLRRAAPGLFEANANARDLLYYFRCGGLAPEDHNWALRQGVPAAALEQLGIGRRPGEVPEPKPKRHKSRLFSKE